LAEGVKGDDDPPDALELIDDALEFCAVETHNGRGIVVGRVHTPAVLSIKCVATEDVSAQLLSGH
jgi:hypothetical protein